uniref:Protein TIC 214 n=1 Tax=Lonicera japonica TaxID=105884 RepID=A0A0D3LS70_LONJA|nr:photosystem I assembly protein Ycf1 [Lonicera japonica]AHN53033.1 photosystem I assembly protein Ycf1 [Lonicera japonica]
MTLPFFQLANLVSLCMKIINSAVVVGLYYGFLTTFCVGSSYLFLLRAHVIEEAREKKISATTGFLMGQLIMFISIYYVPLHLALGRPHTITVLVCPYLWFHFVRWNNDKKKKKSFLAYRSTTRDSMRNLSTQGLFLNHLVFQSLNPYFLPSAMLARLVNVYMFRCNNKILFVTSSFVGWLIGFILLMKGLLVWIQHNRFIRLKLNNYVRFNKYLPLQIKYLMSEFTYRVSILENSMARTFSIILFITCVYYLGRMPSPLLTKKLEKPLTMEEGEVRKKEGDVKIERAFETKGTKHKRELFWFEFVEKLPVILLFDYKDWNRPLRYIKNNDRDFKGAVKSETAQYFFDTCRSDGKQRISFTYPPSLSTFLEMIQRRIDEFTLKKPPYDELYNHWVYTKTKKKNKIKNELLNRIKALDMGFLSRDILEKRTRLVKDNDNDNDKTQKKDRPNQKLYLSQEYDPFLNGPYRGTPQQRFSPSIRNKTNFRKTVKMNKIHGILLFGTDDTDYQDFKQKEFEQKVDPFSKFDQKVDPFSNKEFSPEINIVLTFLRKFIRKTSSSLGLNLKILKNYKEEFSTLMPLELNILSTFLRKFVIKTSLSLNLRVPSLFSENKKRKKNLLELELESKKSIKKYPRWSSKLISEMEAEFLDYAYGRVPKEPHLCSRALKEIVLSKEPKNLADPYARRDYAIYLDILKEPDFERDLIMSSTRAQRRKVIILKLLHPKPQSPLFWGRIKSVLGYFFTHPIKFIFINWMGKRTKSKILNSTKKQTKTREEKAKIASHGKEKKEELMRIQVESAWENLPYGPGIRSSLLLMQSFLRKNISLPLLIIAKNIGRLLFLQVPEWAEDFQELNRERHFPCTHLGVGLNDPEVLAHWAEEGFDIKILYPFRLKPWHRSKLKAPRRNRIKKKKKRNVQKEVEKEVEDDFGFLTILGMETEYPFGSPRKRSSLMTSFFKPIFKKLGKQIKKKKAFEDFKVLGVFKKVISEFSKRNQIPLVRSKKIDESSETKKDSTINNQIIEESFTQIRSIDRANSLQTEQKMKNLTEQEMKNLTDRTSTIKNKIQRLTKDKKKETSGINRSTNSNVESQPLKRIWQILKRRNARLISQFHYLKLHYFLKIFIEKIYIDIFPRIINITRINTQPLPEKILEKYISNNERNPKKMNFFSVSTIKKARSNYTIRTSKKNSHIFYDLSSLSQRDVFFKLSQPQAINLSKLRSALQYHGTSFFLKTAIKDSFEIQGIFHSELKHKKPRSYDQWKNWLRGHPQYNLSPIRWSRLIPQKWRNRVNQRCTTENKDFQKWSSDENEKDLLFHYTNPNLCKVYSVPNQQENFQKYYRYGLLSYKSLNYETKKDSSIYGSTLQVNKKKNLSYNYTIHKLFNGNEDIDFNNFLRKANIIDSDKKPDRKYFDWKMQNFALNQLDNDNKAFHYIQIRQNPEIHPPNSKEIFFDWIKIDKERLRNPVTNWGCKPWFFPEHVLLYTAYKVKPWIIPNPLFLGNLSFPISFSETNKEIQTQKNWDFIPIEKRLLVSKTGTEIIETSSEVLYMKIGGEAFRGRIRTPDLVQYWLFQLKWHNYFVGETIPGLMKQFSAQLEWNLNYQKVSRWVITYLNNKLFSINQHLIHYETTLEMGELGQLEVVILESNRLYLGTYSQIIMYQTIRISLVDQSKQEINQKYRNQRYLSHQRRTGNRKKNHYDFLVPETILSSRRRRELRILISFNLKNRNGVDKNPILCTEPKIRNWGLFLNKSKHLGRKQKKLMKFLMKFKFFLWPNYRLEDLACMNRYWFDTNNGSRFSMLRIYMYPRFKIR